MQTSKFDFLLSPRFWQLFVVGVMAGLTFLFPDSREVQALAITLSTWLGGSVVVRTVDRVTDTPPKQP